jgi:putative MATE family efflux protein
MMVTEKWAGGRRILDRSIQLGQGSVSRLLLNFSTPAIVAALAQALYSSIDSVFLGHVIGSDAIAATTVCLPPMLVVLAFGMLIGFGAAALISIRLGEQRKADAEQVLGNATALLLIASLGLTAAGLWQIDRLLALFGASDAALSVGQPSTAVLSYARVYLQIILAGTVFQCLLFGLNAMIRAEGNPKVAMLSMVLSVLLNLALAPVLIVWLRWGMFGAALATVLAQAISAAWVLLYFLSGRGVLRFRAGNFRLKAGVCRKICALGFPSFAMMLVNSVFHCILINQLRLYGGYLAISVWGIVYRMLMVFFTPIIGLYQGAQPIIGYNYGARRFDRVKRALEVAILAATALMTCGFAVSMGLPRQIIWLFLGAEQKDLPAVVALGAHAIRLATMMLPLVGFQVIAANYFQAVGKPIFAMLLVLSRQVILLIPLLLWLPHCFGLGLDGVWVSFPCADLCSSVLTAVFLFGELRHLREKHLDATADAAAWTPSLARD